MKNNLLSSYHRYPALYFFVLYAAGIFFCWQWLPVVPFESLLTLSAVLFVLSLAAHLFWEAVFVFTAAPLIVLLGLLQLYAALSFFPADHLALQDVKHIRWIEGRIIKEYPGAADRDTYVLQCRAAGFSDGVKPLSGNVQIVRSASAERLHWGDVIRLNGRPQEIALPANPGDFNYRRYLNLKKIYARLYYRAGDVQILARGQGAWWKRRLLLPVRRQILSVIDGYFTGQTAAVLQALLLGQRQNIDRQVAETFKRSGIIHVLAISGLHVGFLLILFLVFFGLLRFPYKWQIGLALLLLFLFVAVVDFKPPVVRAFVMAAVFYWGKLTQRTAPAMNSIAVAGLLVLFTAPQQLLWPDFQFSFAAVLGILYAYPRLNAYLPSFPSGKKIFALLNKWLRQALLISAGAILGTLVLTWYYYGVLQSAALLINILIIPLMGLLVMAAFLFIPLASLHFAGCAGLAWLMDLFYHSLLKAIAWFAARPFVQITLPRPSVLSLLLLTVLIYLLLNLRRKYFFTAAVLVLLLLPASIMTNGKAADRMRVVFVNVGQGDGAFVQFPNGRVLVVDGGDRKPGFDAGRKDMLTALRYYGVRHIDYLLGSHGHSDHIGGLVTLMHTLPVDTLLLSPYALRTKLFARLLAAADSLQIPLRRLRRGDKLNVDARCRVYIMHPFGKYIKAKEYSGREVNNSSLVVKITYGAVSFLLTGDLERSAEPALETYGALLAADVLKVGHHGSKTSTSPSFLRLIHPRYSVVSVGRHNMYFHPSRKTIKRLRRLRAHPLRTDHFGGLVFETDGRRLALVNWRE